MRDVDAVDRARRAAAAPATNASASATVLCIFQLPAISGVRDSCCRAPPRRAASCPSSSSSDAPPPVERWSTRSARPNCGQRRGGVAAADDGRRRGTRRPPRRPPACRRRTARARRRPSGRSRRPCRRRRCVSAYAPAVSRADVEPHPAVGHVDAVELAALGVGGEAIGRARDRSGSRELAARRRRRARARAGSTPSSSHSEAPTSWPWAREERESTSRRRSGSRRRARGSASMTPILSVTLAPPTMATSGRSGSARMPLQRLDLALQQAAGARLGDVARDALGRGVRAVGGAERVVDVDVGAARASRRASSGSFFVSPGSKRTFSSRSTSPGASSRDRASTSSPTTLGASVTGRRAARRGASATGCERQLRARGPSGGRGASRGRAARPRSRSSSMRRQRRADARVVGDLRRPSSGTLKSTRTRTRAAVDVAEVLERRSSQDLLDEVDERGSRSPTRCRTRRRP